MAKIINRLARQLTPRSLRNALRSPRNTAIWLRNESASLIGSRPTLQIRSDWTVRCHPVSRPSFVLMCTDPDLVAETDAFIAQCTPSMVLFDIGASHGFFTLAALRYGGDAVRVVAVDPSATSNRILRENVRLVGMEARDAVVFIEAAVGREDGHLSMLTTGPSGDHYLIASDGDRPDARSVKQFSLPGLFDYTGLKPTHVKIDVEGFEGEVIDGGIELLQRCRPILFLELHGEMLRQRGLNPARVLNRLVECGYRHMEWRGKPISVEAAAQMPIARLVCKCDA